MRSPMSRPRFVGDHQGARAFEVAVLDYPDLGRRLHERDFTASTLRMLVQHLHPDTRVCKPM